MIDTTEPTQPITESQSERSDPMRFAPLLASVLLALSLSGCNSCRIIPVNTETVTVNALNDAIRALQSESADWQQVLKDAQAKLTKDIQSTLRNEIATLLSRSLAQTGVEFRCSADFVGDRVREALIRIRARLLNQPVPPVEPALCQVVPVAIDRGLVPDRRTHIEFYGYDFNEAKNLAVFLESSTGRRSNIANSLDRPTHYAMTLKFGPTGCQLDDHSQRLVLEWGGKQISTIAVIQPPTPVCESNVVPIHPSNVTFVPPKTGRGDNDFHGNGPAVFASLSLIVTPQSLAAQVYMNAGETKKDWTEASGWEQFPLFTPDPGWQIDSVVGNRVSSRSYTDSNVDKDSFDLGSGGPASRFVFVGDTDGSEAGTRTKVDVTFNELRVVLTQAMGCVSESAVRKVREYGLIRETVLHRLEPGLERERQRLKFQFP